MHILFVHKSFPAQFGHIARYLAQQQFRCTFVSEMQPGCVDGVERIQYKPEGAAHQTTHYCSRSFENQIWHSTAVLEALRPRNDIRPDLIVGHSGFVSTLFLRELYDCPMIGYFEYFYRAHNSDIDFRYDLPGAKTLDRLRARSRNAMLLLDMENCDAGYTPTNWQRSQLPLAYQGKIETIFDGIDRSIWYRRTDDIRRLAGWEFPRDLRLVTYVSRGMESIRGFDVFMQLARRLCDHRSDVQFAVVGEDRVAYGSDGRFTAGKTFKQWVLSQGDYDLSRILFLGRLPQSDLARLLSISDLHVYLTAPFVLSWSLLNALSCGATVLASDTAPVAEVVRDGQNGLLCDFFDVDRMFTIANRVLDNPAEFRDLGKAGARMIEQDYDLVTCLPRMLDLYERTQASATSRSL